jgi:hypothetical protein
MAKANLEGVPETGSKWELDGALVTAHSFQAKGRGGYVLWVSSEGQASGTKLSEWKAKAKAA